MIVGARLIGGDMAAEQNREAWIAFDDRVQFTSWKNIDAHGRQATGGVIHRSARSRLKPQYRARKREIQNLARAVVEQCRHGDPTAQDDIVSGTDITLPIEILSAVNDPRARLQISNCCQLFSDRHLASLTHRPPNRM